MWSLNYKKNERKENRDSVMANLNLLVFLRLRKGRGEQKDGAEIKLQLIYIPQEDGKKAFFNEAHKLFFLNYFIFKF